MDSPLLSICIPTYKNRKGLERLVLSTCNLIRSHNAGELVELCISDDASHDSGLEDHIRQLAGSVAVSITIQPVNTGFSHNLLCSARMAHGRYLAFAGDDDVFEERSFPLVIKALATGESAFLFKTQPDAPLTETYSPNICNHPDTIHSPAELLRKLGIFHSTFIGNFIIQRDMFLSHSRETDVLSLYPHTLILLRILESHPAQYLPLPLLAFNGGGNRWNQALLSAIDLARIFTECFSDKEDKKILRLVYTRHVRSIPRAFLNLRMGGPADFKNPHQSLSLLNVLNCYRENRVFQIQAALFWLAGRFMPLRLLSAILGSRPVKVHFENFKAGA